MGGLLAARVLSDHFEQVTLVERDEFPETVAQRRGVPQGKHTHGLLASGSGIIENLFPGILKALLDAGAVKGDIVRDARWFHEGACLSRFPSGLEGLLMTRPFLETMVRRRVLALENVRALTNCAVQDLAFSDDGGRVRGIAASGSVLEGDLVVDTTGRGSRSPQWLEARGYPKPPEDRVEIGLAYTTRFFRRRPQDLNGDIAAIIPPTPEGKRGGVLLAQEGDRWTVTLIAHFVEPAPEELTGFIEYARNLPAPYIYQVVRGAEPVSEPASARFPASVRRRYEQIGRFPEGFLVFGDAISSFNPIYGQGMSVAALEAVELDKMLAEGDGGLARRFFTRAAKVVDIPWSIAVGNDLRMKETVGPRNAAVKFLNRYMGKLHKAAHSDPVPTLAFHMVANLLAPPPSVMHPRVVMRVLWRNLFPGRTMPSPERSLGTAAGK
jgi:2-polyprenyl-6-methoxyphenol hydroxylase-like FAD-dependent oxidoreductase